MLRKQRNTTVILGEAVGLDHDRRQVLLADGGPSEHDTLVVGDGETNWLEGALLVLVYSILAVSFFEFT